MSIHVPQSMTLWPVDKLVPYARNARTHNDSQVAKLMASIAEFGFTNPILVDEAAGILAGHGRLLAARKMGLKEVPVVELTHMTPAQKRAYIIADNRLAEDAGWDQQVLAEELAELVAGGYNPEVAGFSEAEIDRILRAVNSESEGAPDGQVEKASELQAEWKTARGQVWEIESSATKGSHRIICGNAGEMRTVDALFGGCVPSLLFTSPPYAGQRSYTIGDFDWDALMDAVFLLLHTRMKPDASLIVNLGLVHEGSRVKRYWDQWIDKMEAAGMPLSGWYVWDKLTAVPGDWRGRLPVSHEWLFHFENPRRARKVENSKHAGGGCTRGVRTKAGGLRRTGHRDTVNIDKVPESVIRIPSQRGQLDAGDHPAPFSVALPEFCIPIWTEPGDIVYEPFCGSGSTMLAAERTRRLCYAMEIEPKYVAVALQRMADMGLKPRLVGGPRK